VVIEGELTFRDETGQTATVKAGDTFFFPRGSTITFSTDSYGVAWKSGARLLSKL
jgi:ethanolamine utilization protein EutQ (cupin superfamily)